ncbi:hypothetical protein Tco_1175430 [Tanacetum coccineum]
MDNTIAVSPIPTLRIHKDNPKGQFQEILIAGSNKVGKIQKASSAQQALVKNNLDGIFHKSDKPDIMFAVCACARFQVTPKVSHLHAVKRIFRYLKHQPKLGLWYPRDSPFEIEAFSDSDYACASLDRKSTTSGCQFLGRRLISWQCKKQTIVANSTTKAKYVTVAHCCGQNPVYHSRTKHIEIRHHFIRGCYEKRLIDVLKIHTDSNVPDLLTKGFDVTRYALTHNPTIYDSLFKQFWQTATVRTLANGTQQLVASIDSKEYIITKASVQLWIKGVRKKKINWIKGKRLQRRLGLWNKKIDTGLDAEEEIKTGREEKINTGFEEVSTGSTKVDSGTASERGQREGKAPMVEENIQATHKTKEQLRQEEAGLEEAIKLQAQLDEEVAKQIHLDKMIA